MTDDRPRVVVRPDGGLVVLREVDGEIEEFAVPAWVVIVLAKGRWWMDVFAVQIAATKSGAGTSAVADALAVALRREVEEHGSLDLQRRSLRFQRAAQRILARLAAEEGAEA